MRWQPAHRRTERPGSDPDYRFSLANERTFLAWIRTALALLAGGIAVKQLVPPFGIPRGRLSLGIALIVLSLLLSAGSYSRWRRTERAMRVGGPLPRSLVAPLLALGLSLVTVLALVLVTSGG